jgi:hypothetical protein
MSSSSTMQKRLLQVVVSKARTTAQVRTRSANVPVGPSRGSRSSNIQPLPLCHCHVGSTALGPTRQSLNGRGGNGRGSPSPSRKGVDEGSASIATEILGHPRRQILLYRHRIIYAHSPATCRSGRSWPWWWLARALAAPCPFLLRSSAPFLISQESGFRDHARALSLHRDRRIYGCAGRSESLHHWRLSEFSSFVDLSSIKKTSDFGGNQPGTIFSNQNTKSRHRLFT